MNPELALRLLQGQLRELSGSMVLEAFYIDYDRHAEEHRPTVTIRVGSVGSPYRLEKIGIVGRTVVANVRARVVAYDEDRNELEEGIEGGTLMAFKGEPPEEEIDYAMFAMWGLPTFKAIVEFADSPEAKLLAAPLPEGSLFQDRQPPLIESEDLDGENIEPLVRVLEN